MTFSYGHKRNNTNSTPLTTTQLEEYRKILGLLNHCAIHTRPDILYSVSVLATYITTSTTNDLQDAYHVVKYLKGTPTLGLTFLSTGIIEL